MVRKMWLAASAVTVVIALIAVTVGGGALWMSGAPTTHARAAALGASAAPASGGCGLGGVNLRSAGGYAVLASTTVTNTGQTVVKGKLGLSPGSSVTGFPPGRLIGTMHITDPAAAQAKHDLTMAYLNAAGRTLCPVSVSGNLGGKTLAPGLYKSTSGLAISSGDLTLDAHGHSNAVWIFQMASTLVTTAGRAVILTHGAQAANVYWQVGTSATIGVNSTFVGTILAHVSIAMKTGATLHGRALAQIGAVTMASARVMKPA